MLGGKCYASARLCGNNAVGRAKAAEAASSAPTADDGACMGLGADVCTGGARTLQGTVVPCMLLSGRCYAARSICPNNDPQRSATQADFALALRNLRMVRSAAASCIGVEKDSGQHTDSLQLQSRLDALKA